MAKLTPTGTKTGSAVADYDTQANGTWSGHVNAPKVKISVTGASPAAGHQHVLDPTLGKVSEVLGTETPDSEFTGSFNNVFCSANFTATGNTACHDTIANLGLAATDIYHLSGVLYLVVTVEDENGDAVAPSAGNVWAWNTSNATVAQVADSTEVESCPGDFVDIRLAD